MTSVMFIIVRMVAPQTNVYPTAQRRKMRPFEGFQRRAVVIVPTDEDFLSRCEQREKVEGKEIPDSAVLEMKGRIQRHQARMIDLLSVSRSKKL